MAILFTGHTNTNNTVGSSFVLYNSQSTYAPNLPIHLGAFVARVVIVSTVVTGAPGPCTIEMSQWGNDTQGTRLLRNALVYAFNQGLSDTRWWALDSQSNELDLIVRATTGTGTYNIDFTIDLMDGPGGQGGLTVEEHTWLEEVRQAVYRVFPPS